MTAKRVRWLSIAILVTLMTLLWSHITRPPISFVPIASFVPKRVSVQRDFGSGQFRYEIETTDGKKWLWAKGLWEPSKFAQFARERGFFDFDGDGYEEFFAYDWTCLWIFKRRESVKRGELSKLNLPFWFPLPRNLWGVGLKS